MRATLVALGALVLGAVPALAQEIPSVVANPELMDREIDRLAHADKICWNRGEPRSVEWLARRDPGYRAIFRRYGFQEIDDGWRWFRGDISIGNELRPVDAARVKGETAIDLEVHHGIDTGEPWASLRLEGPLTTGAVRFDWSLPPERICMSEGLHLSAHALVSEGAPGMQKIMFVMPLDQEQMAIDKPEVKACSPAASTAVDSDQGVNEDRGRCDREIFHLQPFTAWDLWVSLPESFYVVYPYVPDVKH